MLFQRATRPARRGVSITLALASVLASHAAHAGPWVPDLGHGYVKLGARWLPGIGLHGGDGTTTAYGPYHELTGSVYGEFGVASHVAVWAYAPFVQVFSLGDPRSGATSTTVTPGDSALGVRVGLWQNTPWVVSAGLTLRVPIARAEPVATVFASDAPHAEVGALRVGSGVFDAGAEVSIGRSLGGSWYTAATVGGMFRTGGYDPTVQWSAEVGNRFSPRLAARLRLYGTHAIPVGDAARETSPSGIGSGTSYTGFGLEGEYRVWRWLDVGLGLQGGIVGVRRQSGGPVIDLYLASAF